MGEKFEDTYNRILPHAGAVGLALSGILTVHQ
jgi:hypothetical protein